MPIIEINSLPLKGEKNKSKVLKKIVEEISQTSAISKERLVVYWKTIEPNSYIFNDGFSEFTNEDSHHPVVYLSCLEGKPIEQEEAIIRTIAEALSQELSINKENVAVIYNRIQSRKLFVRGDFIG